MLKYSRIARSVDGYGLNDECQSIYRGRSKRRLVSLILMESHSLRCFINSLKRFRGKVRRPPSWVPYIRHPSPFVQSICILP